MPKMGKILVFVSLFGIAVVGIWVIPTQCGVLNTNLYGGADLNERIFDGVRILAVDASGVAESDRAETLEFVLSELEAQSKKRAQCETSAAGGVSPQPSVQVMFAKSKTEPRHAARTLRIAAGTVSARTTIYLVQQFLLTSPRPRTLELEWWTWLATDTGRRVVMLANDEAFMTVLESKFSRELSALLQEVFRNATPQMQKSLRDLRIRVLDTDWSFAEPVTGGVSQREVAPLTGTRRVKGLKSGRSAGQRKKKPDNLS